MRWATADGCTSKVDDPAPAPHAIDKHLAPAILYREMFQDGVLAAFGHVLVSRSTGTFFDPHRIRHLIHQVNDSIAEMESLRRYEDVAYLKGQMDAFIFIVASRSEGIRYATTCCRSTDHVSRGLRRAVIAGNLWPGWQGLY